MTYSVTFQPRVVRMSHMASLACEAFVNQMSSHLQEDLLLHFSVGGLMSLDLRITYVALGPGGCVLVCYGWNTCFGRRGFNRSVLIAIL